MLQLKIPVVIKIGFKRGERLLWEVLVAHLAYPAFSDARSNCKFITIKRVRNLEEFFFFVRAAHSSCSPSAACFAWSVSDALLFSFPAFLPPWLSTGICNFVRKGKTQALVVLIFCHPKREHFVMICLFLCQKCCWFEIKSVSVSGLGQSRNKNVWMRRRVAKGSKHKVLCYVLIRGSVFTFIWTRYEPKI